MKKPLVVALVAGIAGAASAAYVSPAWEATGSPWGGIDDSSQWPEGVFPAGSTTGLVSSTTLATWIGGGVLQDIAVRVEAPIEINGVGEVALRGGSSGSGITTVLEIDDPANTGFAYTNFTAHAKLTFWSQYGEKMDLSILSGRVETPFLFVVSGGQGTINMRDGLLHADTMDGGDIKINMLPEGTGSIVWDEIKVGLATVPINFASNNLGRITLGMSWDLVGGTNISSAGVFEWMRVNGRLSINGVVDTNASSYIITEGESVDGSTNGWASSLRLPGALTPEENYAAWVDGFGLSATNVSGSVTNDFDLDGLDNLTEYALGGNPTIDDAASINPTISGSAGSLEYVYKRRNDATFRGLAYGLVVTTDDLVQDNWTPVGTALETGFGPIDPAFDSVTNGIPTDTPIGFINLEVTENF